MPLIPSPEPQKPKRPGRPRKESAPAPVAVSAPISVTIRFRSGASETFGCATRTMQGSFMVFSMPDGGGYLQKNVYIALSEIAAMTIVESAAISQPAVVAFPQPRPPDAAPTATRSGPVVYEARKVAALAVRETALGPESQVVDEDGRVTTVNAGFMS